MSNSEIIEGLKYAILRGESLSQAMNTFVSAGYAKIEVEDAAKELQSQQQEQPINYSSQSSSPQQSFSQQNQKPQQTQTTQIVSKYDSPTKPSIFTSNVFVIILVIILFILLGLLAGLFLFKQQVIDFFGNLF